MTGVELNLQINLRRTVILTISSFPAREHGTSLPLSGSSLAALSNVLHVSVYGAYKLLSHLFLSILYFLTLS